MYRYEPGENLGNMTVTTWLERRGIQAIERRYLQAYQSEIAQLIPRSIYDGQPVRLDLTQWYRLHRSVHVRVLRRLPGAKRYEIACEVAGVRSIARNSGYPENEFLWELGWDAWHATFVQSTRLLPKVLGIKDQLSIPDGEEGYWVAAWAFGNANLNVRWIAAFPEMLQAAQDRLRDEFPVLIGRTSEELSEWFSSPRAVHASEIEDQLLAAGFGHVLSEVLASPSTWSA